MIWVMVRPETTPETLGFLPSYLDERDERTASEQIDANYYHGGGWRPIKGFVMTMGGNLRGDPHEPLVKVLAFTRLRDEVIMFYEYDLLVIMQPDGTWEVSRVD